MKRLFIVGLLVLIAAVGFVALVKHDPGYLLISYDRYTLETSVAVAGISIIVVGFLLIIISLLLSRFVRQSFALNRWFSNRGYRRSQQKTERGVIAFIEGRWAQSQRLLSQSAANSETPLINFLFSAWANHQLQDGDKAQQLLRQADQSTSGAAGAMAIAQAKIHIDNGELERGLATLNEVKTSANKQPYMYRLLQQLYIGLEQWDSLAKLLPSLKKHKLIGEEELTALTQRCCEQQLKTIVKIQKGEAARVALLDVWRMQDKAVRRIAGVVLCYAQCLSAAGDDEGAEKILREQLNREWSQQLVDEYGVIKASDSNKQLLHAENWLKQHSKDARLNLCLGRLSLRNQLWGKAREYFEASHKITAGSEACAELGRLLGHLGKHQQSNDYFHQGLLLSTHGLPELPMPVKHS